MFQTCYVLLCACQARCLLSVRREASHRKYPSFADGRPCSQRRHLCTTGAVWCLIFRTIFSFFPQRHHFECSLGHKSMAIQTSFSPKSNKLRQYVFSNDESWELPFTSSALFKDRMFQSIQPAMSLLSSSLSFFFITI